MAWKNKTFIVRIFSQNKGQSQVSIIGLVEEVNSGTRFRCTNSDELWQFLTDPGFKSQRRDKEKFKPGGSK